jgi:hypothetical protein
VYVYCVIFSKFAVRQRILHSIIYPSPQHLADKPSGNHNPKQPQNDAPPTELKQTHRQHNRPAMNSTTLPRHCLNLQNVYSATTFESAKRARNEHLHTLQNTPWHGPISQPLLARACAHRNRAVAPSAVHDKDHSIAAISKMFPQLRMGEGDLTWRFTRSTFKPYWYTERRNNVFLQICCPTSVLLGFLYWRAHTLLQHSQFSLTWLSPWQCIGTKKLRARSTTAKFTTLLTNSPRIKCQHWDQ